MLFLYPLPLAFLCILMLVAAAFGLTGHVGSYHLRVLDTLVIMAGALWAATVIGSLAWKRKTGSYVGPFTEELREEALEAFGLLAFFPTLVVLAAPILFILTGALWTWLIVAIVAFVLSLFVTPPMAVL